MSDHPTDIVRSVYGRGACALRADDEPEDDRLSTLDVRFARFDVWNEIDSWIEGRFLERVSPGAFTKTMKERAGQIVSLFNHGHDPQIGDKVLGRIVDMGERKAGPFLEVALDDTSYGRDLLPGLRNGLYGASYMFRVIAEDWNDEPGEADHNPLGLPERTIREVRLYEAGPVTFPADEGTTVGVRSETHRFMAPAPAGRAAPDIAGEPVEATLLTADQRKRRLALLSA